MKRTLLAAAVAAALLAPSAHAQSLFAGRPIRIGVSGGISVPTSHAVYFGGREGAELASGFNVAGHVAFEPPASSLGLRADLGYDRFGGKELDLGGERLAFDQGILSGTLNAVMKPTRPMPVKPYLIGGLGVYRVRLSASAGGESEAHSTTNVGFNGGAGVAFSVRRLSAFLEARYHYVMDDETCASDPSDTCIDRKATTFAPISFGIMF
jgi:opacity protein-like surface antigen